MTRTTIALLTLALATLGIVTGCTSSFQDPLLDAPFGQRLSCHAIRPVQGNDVLSMVTFNCPDIGISATLNELRDAGWRLEEVKMGEEIKENDTLSSEVQITVRKTY